MSTFDELDDVARRAAAALLADAPGDAETAAALAAVKSEVPTVITATPRVTRSRVQAGRAPILLAGAAALIAFGIAGIIATIRPESVPSGPVDIPTPTGAPVTAPTPSTTIGPTRTFLVADAVGPLTTPEVLYSASLGTAVDQLGKEACSDRPEGGVSVECGPLRPFDPVVTTDGTLLLVDPVNARVVAVDDDTPTVRQLPTGFAPEAVVLGPDEYLYVGGSYTLDSSAVRSAVLAFDGTDLAAPPVELAAEPLRGELRSLPSGLSIGGSEQVTIQYVGGVASSPLPVEVRQVTEAAPAKVSIGASASWELPEGWMVSGGPRIALSESAAVVEAISSSDLWVVVHLDADGSVAMPSPVADGYDSTPFVDDRGIVVLRQTDAGYDVVRYPLPG